LIITKIIINIEMSGTNKTEKLMSYNDYCFNPFFMKKVILKNVKRYNIHLTMLLKSMQ